VRFPRAFFGRECGDQGIVLWAFVLVVSSLTGAALAVVYGLTR
jgi:hypothetical protein